MYWQALKNECKITFQVQFMSSLRKSLLLFELKAKKYVLGTYFRKYVSTYRKTFNSTRVYYSFFRPLGAGIIQGRLLSKGGYNCTILIFYP